MSSRDERKDMRELRLSAESLVDSSSGVTDPVLAPEECLKLVHELRVQHVELELQNDQLRASQAALEDSRARYFDLYDLAPLGYLVAAADGRIIESNLTLSAMLGMPRSELLGNRIENYVVAEDRPAFREWQRPDVRVQGTQICEVRMLAEDSEPFWARMDGSWEGDDLSAQRLRLAVTDITVEHAARMLARSFSQRLIAARETERRLVATALHHDLGSLSIGVESRLFELANMLQQRDDSGAALDAVAQCRQVLRDTVGRIRQIALDVRPPDVELLGPAEALKVYCQRCCGGAGVTVSFLSHPVHSGLSEKVANVLFRCGQEAVHNVLRHSGAAHLEVTLSQKGYQVVLRVADKGRGFDVDFQMKSDRTMGLATMGEMCRSVGGHLDIVSNPVSGTVVLVSVPVEP